MANRSDYISLYVTGTVEGQCVAEKYKHALSKASIGKSCIRFKRLEDINLKILQRAIREGVKALGHTE